MKNLTVLILLATVTSPALAQFQKQTTCLLPWRAQVEERLRRLEQQQKQVQPQAPIIVYPEQPRQELPLEQPKQELPQEQPKQELPQEQPRQVLPGENPQQLVPLGQPQRYSSVYAIYR